MVTYKFTQSQFQTHYSYSLKNWQMWVVYV